MTDQPPGRPDPSQSHPANENRLLPVDSHLAGDLIMALRFYSRLPVVGGPHQRPDLNRIALALPFASLVIGLPPAAVLLGLEWVGANHLFAATLAMSVLAIVTGAMSEDAVADAADGLFGGHTAEDRLAIMRDSRHGTYGVCAIVVLFALRIAAIGSLTNPLAAAGVLLATQVMARSGALWLTVSLPPARSTGVSASAGRVGTRVFAIGAVFTVFLSFCLAAFAVGVLGLVAAYALGALVVWGWMEVCRRLVGGQTGDLIGALQALLEVTALTAFMIFA